MSLKNRASETEQQQPTDHDHGDRPDDHARRAVEPDPVELPAGDHQVRQTEDDQGADHCDTYDTPALQPLVGASQGLRSRRSLERVDHMASLRRSTFILGSIVIHAGLGAGVLVSQIWGIERLDGSFKSSSGLAVMMPPAPAEGGAPKLPERKIEKKQKKIVTDTVQLAPKEDVPVKPTTDLPSTTTGTGEGSGPGSGSARDKGTCLVDCGIGGGSDTPPPVKKDPPAEEVKDTIVPPNVLTMMRISGSTQIHPTDVTKIAMQRDGREKTVGVAKVCVSDAGAVTHVSMLTSTKYPAYDAQLVSGIRSWTYKPYTAHGHNVKVCGTVTFVYGMK